MVRQVGIPAEVIDGVAREEQKELERREHAYRGDRAAQEVQSHTVILVDDGLATGSTMPPCVPPFERCVAKDLLASW